MRQNNAPASSSITPLDLDGEVASDGQVTGSSPVATSSDSGPPSATPFMSQYGQPTWPESASASASASSSPELTNAMHDSGGHDDHDMADMDIEDGGVALTETYNYDDNITSPFTAGPSYDADDFDDSVSVDFDYEMPSTSTAPEPTPPSLIPAGTAMHGMHTFAQLPAFAQQALSNIQPYQAQQLQQAQLAQIVQAQIQAVQAQSQLQQQQQQQQFFNDPEDEFGNLHGALPVSNPNQLTLGPDNFSVADFLRSWARMGRSRDGQPTPRIDRLDALIRNKSINRVHYNDLRGDAHDFQGFDWTGLEVPRSKARDHRRATYKNYVNKVGSDKWHPGLPDRFAIPRDNHYRFRSMDIRRDTRLLHFQLRNILGCTSRTRAFFPSFRGIVELDPTTGRTRKAMDFGAHNDVQVSTVAASDQVLIAGSFLGDYRYRHLDSEDRSFTEGKLTDHTSGITNHVQIHSARRSSAPIAAFASNDFGFRTVDLTTNKLLFESMYNFPLNCSAISTDQRLRVMVGDHTNVLITNAETGEILQNLSGHRDFGFACDWAPDGWTVATGFQDKSVRVWDARRWTNNHDGSGAPIAVLRMDMSGARSLRFSPLGSGKRLLVAAEEADIINVYDAQTFDTQQKIEMFGEIGGTAFADDGRTLMALNTDPMRGGVLQFEKCDGGAEDAFNTNSWDDGFRQWPSRVSLDYDWPTSTTAPLDCLATLETMTERRRKAVSHGNFEPF